MVFFQLKGFLHRRHIEPTANCEICEAEEESIKHALLDCTVAKLFWEQVKLFTGVKVPPLHPLTWARDLVDPGVITAKDAAIILCGTWSLWMTRNRRRHGEQGLPVKAAVQWATDTAYDLWQLSHPIKVAVTTSSQQTWQRPELGWVKCNVDASFYAGDGTAASGVVLRDQDGRTCGGRAVWYEHCLSALAA